MAQSLSIADKIGLGLAAGLAGTIAMTFSQKLEMALSGRPSSSVPAKAVEKVAGVELASEQDEQRASIPIHYIYGTALGGALAGLDRIREPGRTAAFFLFGWSSGAVLLTSLKLAPPPYREPPAQLATDLGHHLVHAVGAGASYALMKRLFGSRQD